MAARKKHRNKETKSLDNQEVKVTSPEVPEAPAPVAPPPVPQATSQTLTCVGVSFSGPLPHPAIMREYEMILPGSAERIMAMAEKTVESNIKIKMEETSASCKVSLRGQTLAFILIFLSLVAACVLGYFKEGAAAAVAAGTAGGLAWIMRSSLPVKG